MINLRLIKRGGRGVGSNGARASSAYRPVAVKAKTYALFHGSPNSNIDAFDVAKSGTNTSTGEKFLFFTDSQSAADEFSYQRIETDSRFVNQKGAKGRVYEVDVTMKNPLDLTNPTAADVKNLIALSGGDLDADSIARMSKGNNQLLKTYIDLDSITAYGYDGFIAKMNKNGDKEYAVVNNDQVKIKR